MEPFLPELNSMDDTLQFEYKIGTWQILKIVRIKYLISKFKKTSVMISTETERQTAESGLFKVKVVI